MDTLKLLGQFCFGNNSFSYVTEYNKDKNYANILKLQSLLYPSYMLLIRNILMPSYIFLL